MIFFGGIANSSKKVSEKKNIENQLSTDSRQNHKDDLFVIFIRQQYFPFLKRFHKYVCFIWLVIFIISVVYGPNFLSATVSNLDLPKGTPSAAAIEAFQANYPDTSSWPPLFIVSSTNDNNVVNSYTKSVSVDLNTFAESKSNTISFVTGYWELINNKGMRLLALENVAADNRTMVQNIYFRKSAVLNDIKKVAEELLKFGNSHKSSSVTVACTGIFALFQEVTDVTTTNFEIIDAVVLPIAILILGYCVQSYRHMGISVANLLCSLLLAFTICLGVTAYVDINPFSPSIMMSLGIAVCFDYSLFMLTRFREEMSVKKRSRDMAVLVMMEEAGHVVALSGMTLFLTFIILVAIPQNFLQSIGYGCSAVVFTALITNLTLTPSLILTFECLEHFDLCPSRRSCCCYIAKDSDGNRGNGTPSQPVPVIEDGTAPAAAPTTDTVEGAPVEVPHPTTPAAGRLVGNWVDTPDSPSKDVVKDGVTSMNSQSSKTSAPTSAKTDVPAPRSLVVRGNWFLVTNFVTKQPWYMILVSLVITAPLLWKLTGINPSSQNDLVYLRGSQSLNAFHRMTKSFPIGKSDPYQIVVLTKKKRSIYSADYFSSENAVVHRVLSSESSYVNSLSFEALSYFKGQDVTFDNYVSFYNKSSVAYNSSFASAYRLKMNGKVNGEASASLIKIETTVDPNGDFIVGFIVDVRSLLTSIANNPTVSALPLQLYLFGGYTTTYDIQVSIYNLFYTALIPTTLAIVLVTVGVSFGSIAIVLRLIVTIAISLIWVYGLMVVVYQPGPGQNAFAVLTPSILTSQGIYWIIPIMSFSILIGLALDYDILLISRMIEFRKLGWSDRASICLAVDKTGNIITAAGLIMSVSFAGLLLPDATVLNQYGFSLFIGVLIDTFFVRTILVPACISLISLGDLNWYPRRMPPVVLPPDEEERALFQGCIRPEDYLIPSVDFSVPAGTLGDKN